MSDAKTTATVLNCWFDTETNFPNKDEATEIWEFACVLEDPVSLRVISEYRTFIHTDVMANRKRNGGKLSSRNLQSLLAPPFKEVARIIYRQMHGHVWLGHNIKRFDMHRITEAFAAIGEPPPTPAKTVDTLTFLQKHKTFWGHHITDLKLCTFAEFYKLADQKHEALTDVYLNREVFQKACATLYLAGQHVPGGVQPATKAKRTTKTPVNAGFTIDECDSLMKTLKLQDSAQETI